MPSKNRVTTALSDYHEKLTTAFAFTQGTSKAEIIKRGLSNVLDVLDEKKREDLIRIYNKLSPDQRKHPER